MKEAFKLLIADDHPIFRKGLKDLLAETFTSASILECNNGKEALTTINEQKPEIAILDINMPEINGLEVCREAHLQNQHTRVIILTMHSEKEMVRKALLYGAYGYILKDNAVQEIVDCINKVRMNEKYLGPASSAPLPQNLPEEKKKKELMKLLSGLSQAELKTLKLVSQNKSSREIAELLFLSEKTIENYRSRICQKLDLPARNNSLVLWVSEHKELLVAISEF